MSNAGARWEMASLLVICTVALMAAVAVHGEELDMRHGRVLKQVLPSDMTGVEEGELGAIVYVPTAPTTPPATPTMPPPTHAASTPHSTPTHAPPATFGSGPKPPSTSCSGCNECKAGGKCDLCGPCKPCLKCVGHNYSGCEDCNTCGGCNICFEDCDARCVTNNCFGKEDFEMSPALDFSLYDDREGYGQPMDAPDRRPISVKDHHFGAIYTALALGTIATVVVGTALARRRSFKPEASKDEKSSLMVENGPRTLPGEPLYGSTEGL